MREFQVGAFEGFKIRDLQFCWWHLTCKIRERGTGKRSAAVSWAEWIRMFDFKVLIFDTPNRGWPQTWVKLRDLRREKKGRFADGNPGWQGQQIASFHWYSDLI